MSFTADEIQTLNDILDKKLSAQSRELERAFKQRFEQRIQFLRREFDQRLTSTQQEIIRSVSQKLVAQQNGMQSTFQQALQAHQMNIAQVVSQEIRERLQQHLQQQLEQEEQLRQKQLLHLLEQLERQEQLRQQQQEAVTEQPQIGELVDNALAAQLLAFEELLNQRLMIPDLDDTAMQVAEHSPHFDAIEVQTELPWEDLMDIFGKALDERFAVLNESTLTAIKNEEQHLSVLLQALHAQQARLHDELEYYRQHGQHRQAQSYTGDLTNMHEVFQSIEQLERIIESMQVAMTTNHALLSNRLYHHQLLPLERAHPGATTQTAITTRSDHATPPNGVGTPLPLTGERGGQ
jgi:hypothetical protein